MRGDTIRFFVEQDARYEWNTDDEYSSTGSSTEEDETKGDEVPLTLTMTRAVCPLTTVRGDLLRHEPETTELNDMVVTWESDEHMTVRVPLSGWTMRHNDKMYLQNFRSPMAVFKFKSGQKSYTEYDYGLYGEIEMKVDDNECEIKMPKVYLL